MAARITISGITRFSGYFKVFNQNTPILHCLKGYKVGSLARVATITYEVRPERLEEIGRSPSGWVPPQDPLPSLPFKIQRSKTNNLPVYIDKKRGGNLVLTVIRNIKGDMNELVRFLKKNIGDDVHFQINEITSQVKIKGYHKEAIVKLLKEHGF